MKPLDPGYDGYARKTIVPGNPTQGVNVNENLSQVLTNMRAFRLIAVHEDYADSDVGPMTLAPFEVGVDSGQAGLFDAQHYRDDAAVMDPNTVVIGDDPGALWYMRCCNVTLTKLAAGVMPYGVVSSSGFGDGSYDCFYGRNEAGKIVRVEIEFIPEEDDDEYTTRR